MEPSKVSEIVDNYKSSTVEMKKRIKRIGRVERIVSDIVKIYSWWHLIKKDSIYIKDSSIFFKTDVGSFAYSLPVRLVEGRFSGKEVRKWANEERQRQLLKDKEYKTACVREQKKYELGLLKELKEKHE